MAWTSDHGSAPPHEGQDPPDETFEFLVVDNLSLPSRICVVVEPVSVVHQIAEFGCV